MEQIWSLKHLILLLIISSCVQIVAGQSKVGNNTIEIAISGKILATDNLEHIYVVDSSNVVNQFSSHGKLLHQFSTVKFGPVHSIDASNPQKILVFYKSFNTIIILDNTMSEIAKIDLQFSDLELEAVCASNQNDIWAYNASNAELVKLNSRGEITSKTTGLEQFFTDKNLPTYMVERNNYVFIKTTKNELYIFDTFGTFYRRIFSEKSGIKDFMVYGNRLICLTLNSQTSEYNMKSWQLDPPLQMEPPPGRIQIRATPNMRVTLYKDKVEIYKRSK